MHVTVCICTYKRPEMLQRLLADVAKQDAKGAFTFSAVVADNDEGQSGRAIAEQARASGLEIVYCAEPRRNIALARNATLAKARGEAIAFIDDDEFPVADWLWHLVRTWQQSKAAGVLGPVRPHFAEDAPEWVRRGGFYNRPEHPTGFVMPWPECRTGNVLLDRAIFAGVDPVFRPEFGSGGEDVDFYRRMSEAGHRFIWCNEAVTYETVPPSRCKRSVLLKRALQRGANSLRQPRGRAMGILKALVAVPLYALALPFLQLAGHHWFMRYLVKLCDHAGRLLACAGWNVAAERQM